MMDHQRGHHPVRTNFEAMRSSDSNVHNMKNPDNLQVISRKPVADPGLAEDDDESERQIYDMKTTPSGSGEAAARHIAQPPCAWQHGP